MMPSPLGVPRLLPAVPALVAALLLGLVVLATQFIVADELSQRALRRVEQATRSLSERVGGEMSRRAAEMHGLAQSAPLQAPDPDPDQVRVALQRLKDSSSSYVWIGWMSLDGTVRAASDGLLEGVNIAHRPVFSRGLQGLWFGSFHPPVALRPVLERAGRPVPAEMADLALPVTGPAGQPRAVLAAHLADQRFIDLLQAVLGPADGRRELSLSLATPDGRTVMGERPPLAQMGQPVAAVVDSLEGESWVVARQPVAAQDSPLEIGWDVVGAQPLRAALAPARELQQALVIGGVVAAALIGGAGVWLSRRLTRPYARVFGAVSERLADKGGQAPAAALDALLAQIQNLPRLTSPGTPGEELLRRVLHDVERIKTVLDLLPAPVYCVDADSRLVYWNQDAARTFGWTAEANGREVLDVIRWVDPPALRQQVLARLKGEPGPWMFELNVERLDGAPIRGEWHLSKVLDAEGRFSGLIAKVRDLTAERDARERLGQQTETLSAIIQSSSDAIISTSAEGRIELFNPAAERIFQVPAPEMLGQPLDRLLPPAHRDGHMAHLQRFAESRTTLRSMGAGRVGGLRADGQLLELEASISQVSVRGRKVLTAILRDVSERARAERQQAQHQMELSELAHRLMEQEQDTTRRLAQILHDGLGQTLAALRLSMEALPEQILGEQPPAVQVRLRVLGELARTAVAEVRQALAELRPPLLESSGLAAALENECRLRGDEAAPAKLHLVVEDGARTQRWPADVEHAGFMVAREALINAMHHAQAAHITVTVGGTDRTLLLDVADDGLGLPQELAFGRPGHLGLVGMRERAIAIGATLSVLAPPEGGTLVRLEWGATS